MKKGKEGKRGRQKKKDRKEEHWKDGEETGVVPLPDRQPLHLGPQKPSFLVEALKG